MPHTFKQLPITFFLQTVKNIALSMTQQIPEVAENLVLSFHTSSSEATSATSLAPGTSNLNCTAVFETNTPSIGRKSLHPKACYTIHTRLMAFYS